MSEEDVPKEGRKPAFEKEELICMVEGLQRNAQMLFGDKERKTPMRVKSQIWADLATAVSAVGPCPRSEIDCKKRWQDLKVRVRKLVGLQKKSASKTGGGAPSKIRLKSWEEVCLSLLDQEAMEGVGTPEYGTPTIDDGGGEAQTF